MNEKEQGRFRDPLGATVFHEPWWLSLVAGPNLREVEVVEKERVCARMPYFFRRQLWLATGTMPPVTHFLGPLVEEGAGSPDTRFLRRLNLTRELIRRLPPLSSFVAKCHGGMEDAIAFQMEGFHVRVQFTHEISPAEPDVLWAAMHHKKRSVITRAQKRVIVGEMTDPKAFMAFYRDNLDQKGLVNTLDLDICEALAAAAIARGSGFILAARQPSGTLAGAVFCVQDKKTCYYFMTTRKVGSHTGVISLLLWEAIKRAAAQGLIFDFDGLFNSGSVQLCCDFGARVAPRYIVMRESWFFRALRLVRSLWKEENVFVW